jgi:hypothetical protein
MAPQTLTHMHSAVGRPEHGSAQDGDCDTIDPALPLHGRKTKSRDHIRRPQDTRTSQGREKLENQMISRGWCPQHVSNLSQKFDLHTFAYLATFKRSAFRLEGHQLCQARSSCVLYNTNPATYKIRHTTADCACPTISVDYQSLLKIIEKDRVPLVSIERGTDITQYKLHIHSRSRRSKYIAISHVWADGLGNPSMNGLPACQIEQLMTSLSFLQKVRNFLLLALHDLDTC